MVQGLIRAALCFVTPALLAGCAHLGSGAATQQQARASLQETAERSYPLSAAELWREVQAHYAGDGVERREDAAHGLYALRTGFQDALLAQDFPARVRWFVQVQQEGAGRSTVRIFRATLTTRDNWSLLPMEQLPTVQVEPEEGEAAPTDADPMPAALEPLPARATRFGEGFFRDLEAEHRLRVKLEREAASASAARGIPLASELVAGVAVGHAEEGVLPLPEPVREARCGALIPGFDNGHDQALERGGTLLLGMRHGTEELPRFAARAACHAAHAGMPVVLALELPLREQPALDAYLASDGQKADVARLTRGPFWHRPEQDGRSSRAMVDLIERARLLGRQGLPVRLLAFDVDGLQGSERAAAMAQVLLARRKHERASLLLVLTGNVQASLRKGVSWDPTYTPVGYLLAREGVRVKAFDVAYRRGTVWDCLLDPGARAGTPVRCSAHAAPGSDGVVMGPAAEAELARNPGLRDRATSKMNRQKAQLRLTRAYQHFGAERFLFVHMAPNQYPPGFDGYFYVPQLTASPPVHGVTARAERSEVSR